MRPHVELDAAVAVAVGVLGGGHVISAHHVQGEPVPIALLQDRKRAPRDEQQAPVVVAVEVAVARAPFAVEAVADIDDRTPRNNPRALVHVVLVAQPRPDVGVAFVAVVLELDLAARLAGDVLRLQPEGAEGQEVVARHAGVHAAVLAAAAPEVALALIENRVAVEECRADAAGDFEAGPVLERIDVQVAFVSLIAPVVEGACHRCRRRQLIFRVDADPIAVVGVVPGIALEEFQVDEMRRDVPAPVVQLQTGKIIGQDIEVVAVAVAEDAAAKTQPTHKGQRHLQEDVFGLDVHPVGADTATGARSDHRHQVPTDVAAFQFAICIVAFAAPKTHVPNFHAVMHAQQIAGAEVPVQAQAGIEEGLGGAVGNGKAAAFAAARVIRGSHVAVDAAQAEIATDEEKVFFRKNRQVLAPGVPGPKHEQGAHDCHAQNSC